MANPRIAVGFEEQDLLVLSFKVDDAGITKTALNALLVAGTPGFAVSMKSSDTVSLGTAGDRLVGVVQSVDNDAIAGVQVKGTARLKYTSTAPAVGESVECHGDGTVQVATSTNVGSGNIVYKVDTGTTSVWVRMF